MKERTPRPTIIGAKISFELTAWIVIVNCAPCEMNLTALVSKDVSGICIVQDTLK